MSEKKTAKTPSEDPDDNITAGPHSHKVEEVTVQFTEEMKGEVLLDGDRSPLMFRLTIHIPNLKLFFLDPQERGTADGYIECEALGGKLPVENGIFHLFVDAEEPDSFVKFMRYELPFKDSKGKKRMLVGHKVVQDDGIIHIWRDTSTLFYSIDDGAEDTLHIQLLDFIRQMFSFKTTGPSWWERTKGLLSFFWHFICTLWSIYFSSTADIEPDKTRDRDIPLLTLEGVKDAEITSYPITTEDQMGLDILRFKRAKCRDVVVLLHGLSTSTDMFVMPEHYNLVSYLLDNGYEDVFSFDWRGSMRYPYDTFPNTFNMDDVALYDHPAAFKRIRELVGKDARIHVICHCVGSISFMMSHYAGLVEAHSIISNSVSLTPQVNTPARIKMFFAPFFMLWILRWPNFNPRWGNLPGPGVPQGKIFAKIINFFHPECDVEACHMLSFMWGYGHPVVYQHENMLEVTHRRVGDLFGAVAISFYLHLIKCIRAGKAIKDHERDPRYDRLPNDYLDYADRVHTPTLLISGDHNNVFPGSNLKTFEILKYIKAAAHVTFKWIPGYGHQDTFMGKNSDKDVFPLFLEHLRLHSKPSRKIKKAKSKKAA
jgi:cholesterol oxidase